MQSVEGWVFHFGNDLWKRFVASEGTSLICTSLQSVAGINSGDYGWRLCQSVAIKRAFVKLSEQEISGLPDTQWASHLIRGDTTNMIYRCIICIKLLMIAKSNH